MMSLSQGETFTIYPQIFDLTLIYGVGLEPNYSTFITQYPNVYYPYAERQNPIYSGFWIDTIYECTVAEMLGYMAGLIGCNAIFDSDNKLTFRWYTADLRYGTRWQDLLNLAWQDLDGTWETEFVDIVNFDRSFQHQDGLSLNEGTFTINSITSGSGDNVYTAGTGKGITFENPYITQELVNSIYANLPQDYKTFYVGEVNTFGMPCAEVGDIVYAQMKDGEKRVIYLSNNTWNLTGGCSCITQSVGVPEAEIEFSTESPTDKKINKFKSTIQEVKSRLSNLINSTVGYYTMTEENGIPTGWTIKDNIEHPQNMVKASLGGIGYSRDGGITYDNAITGEGIIADAITTGTLTVGGTDADHKIEVQNANGEEIGSWSNNGISIRKGEIVLEGSKRFNKSNYSVSDAQRVLGIISQTITPTESDYDKLDINCNGIFTSGDSVIIQKLINGDYGTYYEAHWEIVISASNSASIYFNTWQTSQNGSVTKQNTYKEKTSRLFPSGIVIGSPSETKHLRADSSNLRVSSVDCEAGSAKYNFTNNVNLIID